MWDWSAAWAGFMETIRSPGGAATGVLLAAFVAFMSARLSDRKVYEATLRQQDWDSWWARAQWSLERVITSDHIQQSIGLAAAVALLDEQPDVTDLPQWWNAQRWLQAAARPLLPSGPGEDAGEDVALEEWSGE